MNVPLAVHPDTHIPGTAYWETQDAWQTNAEANLQILENRLELSNDTLFGEGVVAQSYTAPLLAIGAGLTVTVAPHTSLMGFGLTLVNAASIVVPASQAAVWLWEYQDNTDALPHYTTTLTSSPPAVDPSNPLDTVLLGTCATGVATVTSVNDTLRTEVLPYRLNKQPVEEYFTQATGAVNFDANDDRTLGAGPHNTVTTAHPIAPGTVVETGVGRERYVLTDDFTLAGQVITYLSGAAPINGEKVWLKYVPL